MGDSAFFHGREDLTDWLLAKIRPTRHEQRFLAILGPSGSGKSSLARAGLLAALKNGEIRGSQHWPHVIFKPGAHPLESLALALTQSLRPNDSPSEVSQLARSLGTESHTLHITASLALRGTPGERYLVLLIDQFEEVFTLCKDEAQRQALIDNLLYAAREPAGQTAVVLTLRSDFYGRCAAYPELAASISDNTELVGPMTEKELRSAIEEPAKDAHLELEGGLADLLMSEVQGQPGGLPLLQHALLQIWERREERRDGRRWMTVAAYREIGGVAGALQGHAEQVFSSFTREEGETCRRILLCLVQVNDQQRVTKRRVSLDELIRSAGGEADRKAIETVVSRFTAERLLTTGDEGRPTVEIAHEALLTAWKRLAGWIQDQQEDLQTRDRLEEAAREWIDNHRDPSYLYSGVRLSQAEDWKARHPGELSSEAQELVTVSVAQREEEQARKRRQRRRVMALLSTAVLAAVVTAFTMFGLWKKSERQLNINLATQMVERAKLNLPSNPLISLLLGIKAVQLHNDLPAAKAALLNALALADGRPLGKPGIVATAPSADHRSMATASREGTVTIWDLEPEIPREVRTLDIKDTIKRLAVSSDRRWLLTSDQDSEVRLWDLKKKDQGILLPIENWWPGDPFSLDSRWLVTQRLDTPVLRSLGSDSQPKELKEWPRELEGLRSPPPVPETPLDFLSSDGQWRALAYKDGSVALQSVSTRIELHTLGQPIQNLFFVREDRQLVAQAGNESPRLWDLTRYPSGKILAAAPEGARRVEGVPDNVVDIVYTKTRRQLQGLDSSSLTWAFSPDGLRLAAGSPNGQVLLWNLKSGNLTPRTITLEGPITKLAFHPQGSFLAIGGQGIAWLWDFKSEPTTIVRDQTLPIISGNPTNRAVSALAFGSEPPRLAVGWDQGRVLLFELSGLRLRKDLSRATAVTALSFSPDGKVLAIAEANGKAYLSRDGSAEIPLENQDRNTHVLTFSKDGRWLAGGGEDGTLQLWSVGEDRPSGVPVAWKGHPGAIRSLTFTNDGRDLITTGATDSVRRWPLDPDEMIRVACARAGEGRNLTKEEWARHAPAGATFREGAPCEGVGPPQSNSKF